jgi:hypothetical protein
LNPGKIRIRIYTDEQHLPGIILRMSELGSTTSVMATAGATRTAIQISVPILPSESVSSDPALEAAVQRVATLLYMRSHLDVPPDVTDMGGGVFNVLV